MFDLDLLFQKSELIPVIVQHADTKDVLMLGFTNREAVELTLEKSRYNIDTLAPFVIGKTVQGWERSG